MKLKVNRKNVTVFEGAEVRHAVLSYLALKGMDVAGDMRSTSARLPVNLI